MSMGGRIPRYGLKWNGPNEPVPVPMPDGYWTPWHLAQTQLSELEKENTKLRGILARSKEPCVYCGLTDMSLCQSGFPGCSRMDDLLADSENT